MLNITWESHYEIRKPGDKKPYPIKFDDPMAAIEKLVELRENWNGHPSNENFKDHKIYKVVISRELYEA